MLAILSFFLLWLPPAQTDNGQQPLVIEGQTMGTTYRVLYYDEPRQRSFKASVDSLLTAVNKSINTYDPQSEISRFNRSEKGITLELPYLYEILKDARKIFRRSDGAFDPTVMPLVNTWGFGPGKSPGAHPAAEIDSLKRFVGFDKIVFDRGGVWKSDPRVQLDMGGIGQGFGADAITDFLASKGIRDMLVELGGEGVACGQNAGKGQPWRVGILDPNSTPDNQFFKAYVVLRDKAFTTSGNYFNYRIIDGRKLGHTIDPLSGHPVQHSLLSASVFARDCATADAWATAFMVMGTEKAIERSKRLRNIGVLLMYSSDSGALETYISPGMRKQTTLE